MTTYTASMNQLMDTHQAIKDLVNSGFVEGQAEAIVSFQVRFLSENVSTKKDVALIQGNIAVIHKDIAVIHKNIASLRAETSKDIASLKAETKKDIESLRAETSKDIASLKAETSKDIASLKAETKKDIEMLRAETRQGFIGVQKDIEILRAETKKDIQTESTKLVLYMGAIGTAMVTVIVTILGGLQIYLGL